LDYYTIDDFKILGALLKILREKGFFVENIFELEKEIKRVAEEIELDKFEKLLFKDNEQSLFEDIDQLNGYDFEDFLKNLFSKMGYRVEQTRLSGDQGADLVVVKFGEKKVIQAKRFGAKVGNKAVQEIMAAISLYQAQKGMVITNNYFTPAAVELADANNIELIDRDALEELINKHW
jgi:HJR/Mrr/RecB family endonuclease